MTGIAVADIAVFFSMNVVAALDNMMTVEVWQPNLMICSTPRFIAPLTGITKFLTPLIGYLFPVFILCFLFVAHFVYSLAPFKGLLFHLPVNSRRKTLSIHIPAQITQIISLQSWSIPASTAPITTQAPRIP
jgi:hypothetical protein